MSRFLTFVLLGALSAMGVTGCGEREQSALYKDGKYRGKPDMKPWDNPPPAYGSSDWTKGNRATWENQMRSRNAGQNEHERIGR